MLGCLWVLREFGSEVRFWLEVCGSDWETHSPWILARWVWGNVDRRLGFGRRYVDQRCVDRKCVDRTEKLTYRGSDRDWEMERKLTVDQIGIEKWKGNSLWVCVWRSSDYGWSCEECVWSVLWGVCCCEECVWELVLLWGVCCCERAQTVLCEEWKWFEVKIWT